MEDKETIIEEVSVNDAENVATAAPESDVKSEMTDAEKMAAQIAELNDKYLRMAAELENTRRRAALDCESAARNRAMGVAKNFLPVMDAIQSAIAHNPDDAGIIAMRGAMESAFAQTGIVKIDSVGQILNPQFHNAIQIVDAPDPNTAPNTIVSEMQTGYMFGDVVLRTAMVVVAK